MRSWIPCRSPSAMRLQMRSWIRMMDILKPVPNKLREGWQFPYTTQLEVEVKMANLMRERKLWGPHSYPMFTYERAWRSAGQEKGGDMLVSVEAFPCTWSRPYDDGHMTFELGVQGFGQPQILARNRVKFDDLVDPKFVTTTSESDL